ncbi:MAG: LamG domain-containing protein [Candidatus Paceibacterota bacterium]|jgi:prepilin-type N-terminal cleavage/methylation domain-containing protein|nr:LamG domain-containing protein [Candidatus Paceibacterota bacterium]MDD5555248.1 LamG domain-containing protein [Candidatus Paceibacterota bacterium]
MNKSFTLIEILVVIVIIGIISAFIIVSMAGVSSKATITKGKVFLNSVDNSLLLAKVSQWKLDEINAGQTPDSWGTNNGTVTGATLQESGCVSGKCLAFNGSSDFIGCGAGNSLNIIESITISVWIKPMGSSGQEGIIGTPNFSGAYGLYIRHSAGQDVGFQFNNGSNRYYLMVGTLNYGDWNYIVSSWDGSNMKIYVNNTKYSGQGSLAEARNFQEFRIGYTGSIAAPVYFNGLIDDVRIYNAAIPSSQIQENYYSGLNRLYDSGGLSCNEYGTRIAEFKNNLASNKNTLD